jgi:hypothetical protein
VYVRKSVRLLPTNDGSVRGRHVLDIANISIDEAFIERGLGTAIFALIHDTNPCPVTYVENVCNTALAARLIAQGWKPHPQRYEFSPCFFKETGRSSAHGGLLGMMAERSRLSMEPQVGG